MYFFYIILQTDKSIETKLRSFYPRKFTNFYFPLIATADKSRKEGSRSVRLHMQQPGILQKYFIGIKIKLGLD
jgi:hypothetical protein